MQSLLFSQFVLEIPAQRVAISVNAKASPSSLALAELNLLNCNKKQFDIFTELHDDYKSAQRSKNTDFSFNLYTEKVTAEKIMPLIK